MLGHDQLGHGVPRQRAPGVQFHPEVTPRIVGDWITADRNATLNAQGLLEVTSREYATASAAGRRLLSTYIHSLARRLRLNITSTPSRQGKRSHAST